MVPTFGDTINFRNDNSKGLKEKMVTSGTNCINGDGIWVLGGGSWELGVNNVMIISRSYYRHYHPIVYVLIVRT